MRVCRGDTRAAEGILERLEGGRNRALEAGTGDGRRDTVGSFRVADFSAGVAAVSSQRELATCKIMHAKMEELHRDGMATSTGDDGIDPQVHVAIWSQVIVSY